MKEMSQYSVRSFQFLNFLSQAIYSFANNPSQIIDERTLGHVHLQGKRFSTVFLLFALKRRQKSTVFMLVCGSFNDRIKMQKYRAMSSLLLNCLKFFLSLSGKTSQNKNRKSIAIHVFDANNISQCIKLRVSCQTSLPSWPAWPQNYFTTISH